MVSSIARDAKEGRDIPEAIDRDCHLDTAARVRADGAEMEVADRHIKAPLYLVGERPGAIDLGRIVINVGVEIADGGGVGHGRNQGM